MQSVGISVANKSTLPSSVSPAGRISLNRFAWFTLAYSVAVVLWGAYVRATGSGAGCGSRWPLCNGEFLPTTPQTQTVIEFTHRVTSGLSLVLVAILLIWCWRRTAKSDWPRYSAVAAAVLLLDEALLGALLVLRDHVGGLDRSSTHALFLCLHFGNTLLLLAALALTARWLSNGDRSLGMVARLYQTIATGLGVVSVVVIGITGSLASFGDTFHFPAATHCTGMRSYPARLLVEQSHSVALEGPPPHRRSDRFHLCLVAASIVLEKARTLAMDAPSYHHTGCSDCARHNERDPFGPCLAADYASTRCRNVLDPARTCVRRSIVCQPPFGPSGFPKREQPRYLEPRLQGYGAYQPRRRALSMRQLQIIRKPDSRTRSFANIENAIAAIRAGQMVIVVDDEDRENEGDLTIAAEKITPQAVNFSSNGTAHWTDATRGQ